MYTDIPEEALLTLRPMVDALLSAFHEIEASIPLTTDSALIYMPLPEDQA